MGTFKGFDKVKMSRPKRSQFDLSHQKRSSTRMGRLTPVLIMETVPSDTFYGQSEILLRLAPLLAPIYDNIEMYVHYYFVPNRLLWEEWDDFFTTGRLGPNAEDPEPIPPNANIQDYIDFVGAGNAFVTSSLWDYLGVPQLDTAQDWTGLSLDMLPLLAYQKVYMDYYRDRNFVDDTLMEFPVASGEMSTADVVKFSTLRTRNYRHDYFNSALPFTQRGDEVLMPLAGTGSVNYKDVSEVYRDDGTEFDASTNLETGATPSTKKALWGNTPSGTDGLGRIENIDSVDIDASSVAINDFRTAYALQVWLERNAVAGSRPSETTMAHFGIWPQDSRLQRAEYIGGMKIPVKISEIVSTAYSSDGEATVPLANMAGHGITYGKAGGFKYFCPEFGFIIGIASIMNRASYHQGLPRMFYKRRSFLSLLWPTFAKLGEQPVDKCEIYGVIPANLTEDENGELPLFGYQSRYAEYKYIPDSNHGDFHDTLLFWTLTRDFADTPVLGQSFNEFEDSTQDRIFAVNGDGDNFWMYIHNRVSARRPLPYFGTPNTLGF